MGYGLNKYNAELRCFAVFRDGFTEQEIEKIVFLEKLYTFDKGKVGNENKEAPKEIRDSEVFFIRRDENSEWIFNRFNDIIGRVNHDHFLYNIEVIDGFQYTKYGLNQHYNWHWDLSFGWQNYQRKISLIMMLNDPEDYEGGEFEICTDGNIERVESFKPKKGDIVFFASWMPHRVKPVISGERRSLVTWVMGKREC